MISADRPKCNLLHNRCTRVAGGCISALIPMSNRCACRCAPLHLHARFDAAYSMDNEPKRVFGTAGFGVKGADIASA